MSEPEPRICELCRERLATVGGLICWGEKRQEERCHFCRRCMDVLLLVMSLGQRRRRDPVN